MKNLLLTRKLATYVIAFMSVVAVDRLVLAESLKVGFAKVEVETPGELKLGKVLQARVAITLAEGAPVMVVHARTEGAGLTLPLKREWRFVKLQPGKTTEFKVPYQLTKSFQSGSVHFDISTFEPGGSSRKPAHQQTATLKLSR